MKLELLVSLVHAAAVAAELESVDFQVLLHALDFILHFLENQEGTVDGQLVHRGDVRVLHCYIFV